MISLTSNALKVRLVLGAVDMRKSFNGLTGAIRALHEAEPDPGSAEAGEGSAILYTLVENYRALGMNPRDYLVKAIKGLTHHIEAVELIPAKLAQQLKLTQSEAA